MTLAKCIRDCRYANGWGPDELAHRAEISRTALYQIECGKTETPRAGTLRRIAQALGVSIDVLLGNAEWEHESGAQRLQHHPAASCTETSDGSETLDDFDSNPKFYVPRSAGLNRDRDLERKLRELLASPFGEGVARIVEETHRMLSSAHIA